MTQLDMNLVNIAIGAAVEIIQRHFSETGQLLSKAEVEARVQQELKNGQGKIADWYVSKGLPIPK